MSYLPSGSGLPLAYRGQIRRTGLGCGSRLMHSLLYGWDIVGVEVFGIRVGVGIYWDVGKCGQGVHCLRTFLGACSGCFPFELPRLLQLGVVLLFVDE